MSAFSAAAAVLAHTHGTIATFNVDVVPMVNEDFLLIHSVGFAARREKKRVLNADGKLIFRADFDPTLSWSVRATVLDWQRLADYHPGTPLSRQALVFANGARTPFQFQRQVAGEDVGVLYFEDPDVQHEGGDTPEIGFRIALEFSDIDVAAYPGTEAVSGYVTYVPGVAVTSDEIPDQAAETMPVALRTAVCQVFFQKAEWTGFLTVALHNGATELTDPQYAVSWNTLSEPVDPLTSRNENSSQIWDATSAPRTINRLRYTRSFAGSDLSCDIDLAAPISLAAWRYLTAPAGSLLIDLEWPWDGATSGGETPAEPPARSALREWLNDSVALTSPVGDQILIRVWDDDPSTTGVEQASWYVDRSAAVWTVDAAGVRNAVALTDIVAVGGDTTTEYVTAELPDVPTWLIKMALHIETLTGNPITIPSGDLDLVF